MNILFIGDIFGKPGRTAIAKELPSVVKDNNIDLVIANAENTTHGKSITVEHYKQLKDAGVNLFTLGNHTWNIDEIYEVLKNKDVVRPLNVSSKFLKESTSGNGTIVVDHNGVKIRLTNLLGQAIPMHGLQTNPFLVLDRLTEIDKSDIHIVDFHAETTSEKNALMLAFKGKVSAILGTHTHVQTADEKLDGGTLYITDVGMTGPANGIIGAEPSTLIDMFFERRDRFKLSVAPGKYQFCAVVLSFDDNNKPIGIKRIYNIEK
ncbi:MAG: TIGR00282 family metallophosphoesterase [Mycoplasmataceae bacterium]|jgi:metallophosphoesterase (TIGR00282 family)|nr:TIGR00282 family metallophosphoesterase [Mycoplasmataceae bacterium]